MNTKEECLKKLSKIGKEVFKVMESTPPARSNKYKLLVEYNVQCADGWLYGLENNILNGNINIEAIFTAQRQIWKFYPHWKKAKKETEIKHEAYKEHKLTNPVQGDLF